jgi:hypothetical protein
VSRGTFLASDSSRIALVKPIFSATAYSSAFYVFYSKYSPIPWGEFVTKDLNLLNRTVVDGWGYSESLCQWFGSAAARSLHLILGETVTLINEIQVDQGALFRDGVRIYDVVILGFTEYVTEREYLSYKQFVESGGTLIIMDACNFLAQVDYSNGYLSLVSGHGWAFNGTHAWKANYHRWPDENANWIGSNYWKYWSGRHYDVIRVNTTNAISDYLRNSFGTNISTSYGAHEENLLMNFTETDIIGYWNLINPSESPSYPVAAYLHRYGKGMVIHSGIMASDVMSDKFFAEFIAVCIRFAFTGDVASWKYPEPLVLPDDAIQSSIAIHGADGGLAAEPLSGLAYCDIDFSATRGVLRACHRCDISSVNGVVVQETAGGQQLQSTKVLKGRSVSNTSWRLDMNTFLFPNGNCTLTINATWRGEESSLTFNETMASLNFTVMNSWLISIIPWALPLGAALGTALVLLVYTRLDIARSRKSSLLV